MTAGPCASCSLFRIGAGALAFVWDWAMHGSPASFLLFAASDGALAVVTLLALLGRSDGLLPQPGGQH